MSTSLDPVEYVNKVLTNALDTDQDVIPSVLAAEIVDNLRTSDPDALSSWLDAQAEAFVRDALTQRIRTLRARARSRASAGAFARAAKRFERTGDAAELSVFDVRYVVDGSDTQRRVADMNATDCLFVADRYDTSAKNQLMLAAFHRAVAIRIGTATVGSVFSPETYDKLYRSITGRSAAEIVA